MERIPKRLRVGLDSAVVLTVAVAAGSLIAAVLEGGRTIDPQPPQSGQELIIVFIASSTCQGIGDPRLPGALHDIRSAVAERYRGARVVSIGVSTDLEPAEGVKLLERFGPFEEVHAGWGFLNTAAQKYIVDFAGIMAIPQVVIMNRQVSVRGGIMRVIESSVITRRAGAEAIIQFADALGA